MEQNELIFSIDEEQYTEDDLWVESEETILELAEKYCTDGPEMDVKKAVICLEIGAERGSLVSMFRLMEIYTVGKGSVAKDPEKAQHYCNLIVMRGYSCGAMDVLDEIKKRGQYKTRSIFEEWKDARKTK